MHFSVKGLRDFGRKVVGGIKKGAEVLHKIGNGVTKYAPIVKNVLTKTIDAGPMPFLNDKQNEQLKNVATHASDVVDRVGKTAPGIHQFASGLETVGGAFS